MINARAIDIGYKCLIDEIVLWAEQEPAVRAAVLIGSRARTEHLADQWSDLDVLLFVREPERFAHTSDWVEVMGSVWLTFVERTPDDAAWERRVLYAGGLDVDFALNPADWLEHMAITGLAPEMAEIARRGVRVLADKDGLLAKILQHALPEAPLFVQPSAQDFSNVVNDFWYHSLWSAKHLRRGELWWAKSGVDWRLKDLLERMIEWHAHSIKGAAYDTWLRGRFLEEWADPRVVAQLDGTFARYDKEEVACALWATMNVFRWITRETAQRWHYPYPEAADEEVTELVGQILREMTQKNLAR